MRPKEIELVALLESGDLDYAWFYESLARASGVRYVQLPGAVDLGSAEQRATYATAMVRVIGGSASDTVTMNGAPIRYAFSIPLNATRPALAERFAVFLLSNAGRQALRTEFLAPLDSAGATGDGVPGPVRALLIR
jgi:molybdate/tungstate transport system substrate-binding protein